MEQNVMISQIGSTLLSHTQLPWSAQSPTSPKEKIGKKTTNGIELSGTVKRTVTTA